MDSANRDGATNTQPAGTPEPVYPARFDPGPPRSDLSEDELSHAFADNLFELFRAMTYLPGAELDESSQLSCHLAPPFSPMFKGIWRSRLAEHEADGAIVKVVDWFKRRSAPFAFWWLDSRATPVNLAERLQAHGFVPWEEHALGMAAELSALKYELMANVPQGYTQERVADEQGLIDFKTAFVNGFEVPEWAGQAWVDATLAFGIENAPWQCYVGRLNGTPVASSILFNGAGVASVFGVATVALARGKGIGAAITLIAYEQARLIGYRYGVLFGTELGVPVYHRIGFRDGGSTMSRYLWRP